MYYFKRKVNLSTPKGTDAVWTLCSLKNVFAITNKLSGSCCDRRFVLSYYRGQMEEM